MDVRDLFGGQSVDITCPSCTSTFTVASDDLLKHQNVIKCPSCHFNMEMDTEKEVADMNSALQDFENALKNFGK